MRVERQCALLASNQSLRRAERPSGVLAPAARRLAASEQFGVVNLGDNRIALRASTGSYVSLRELDGTLVAEAASIGDREVLRRIEMDGGRVAFAAAAMSHVVAASNPALEKQSRAASRMRHLVASFASAVTLITGLLLI